MSRLKNHKAQIDDILYRITSGAAGAEKPIANEDIALAALYISPNASYRQDDQVQLGSP